MIKLTCPECKHKWIPRVENPLKCPKCLSLLKKDKKPSEPKRQLAG